jgi:hypothetical protein
MAKKSAEKTVDPVEEKAQIPVISLKGSIEMRDWLKKFSKTTHYPAATLVRLGLASEAKRLGFEPPPEK